MLPLRIALRRQAMLLACGVRPWHRALRRVMTDHCSDVFLAGYLC